MKRITLLGAVTTLALFLALPSPTGSAFSSAPASRTLASSPSTVPGGDLDGAKDFVCIPLAKVGVQAISSSGRLLPSPDAAAGKVNTFREADGTVLKTYTPPPGFNPLTASDEALEAFRLPPRPTDAADLKQWQEHYSKPLQTESGDDAPCLSNDRGASLQSPSWSGRVDQSSGFSDVQGDVVIPTFSAGCPHASTDFLWAGIGGLNSNGVLQAGVTTTQSGVNTFSAVTEVYPKEGTILHSVPVINAGDRIYIRTHYVGPNVYWTVYNVSSGDSRAFEEDGISSYYYSNSVEWIDERVAKASLSYPVDGTYYYYRKHTPTYWSGESANGHSAGYWNTAGAYMYSNSYHVTLGTAALPDSSTSTHNWQHCPGE